MRKKIVGIGVLVLAVFGLVLGGAAAYKGTPGPNPSSPQTPAVEYGTNYTSLSADEQNGLLYMVEEEKLARDVYLTLYNETGLQVFGNIAQSEQRHMDVVLSLMERYNLTVPATLNEVGVFQNEELQSLYNKLVAMGSENVTDALKVGALIEETDIKDLQDWMAKSDNADINSVYERLMMGSEDHLRAFTRNLEVHDVTYTPQVLSEEQYNKIISSMSGMMKGNRQDHKRGYGHGQARITHRTGMKAGKDMKNMHMQKMKMRMKERAGHHHWKNMGHGSNGREHHPEAGACACN